MSLVSTNDIYQNTGLKKLGVLGKPLAYGLLNIMGLNGANALYDRNKMYESPEFEGKLLEDLDIHYEIADDDLKRIPKTGPFIVVANHPLGALDGIIMLKIFSEVRPDFKIIANFILHKVEPLKPKIFPVNPFESRKDAKNSAVGMKNAYRYIKEGHPLGVFPAGEVSQKDEDGHIVDREWQLPIIKMIRKAKVPVVPMYFHAKNSKQFYQLGKLHPDIQTALLPRELMRERVKPIKVRIGKPIPVSQQEQFTDDREYGLFLRRKTYMLSAAYSEKKRPIPPPLKFPKTRKKIVAETPLKNILPEIKKLQQDEEHLLFENNNYQVFFAKAKSIPNILREIGRLREITFREIGEGTNKSIDLDKYDDYYSHLFLWDSAAEKIVGAYRMGMGKEIYEKYGISGFYVSQLFDFDNEIAPFFSKSIEMGRAFVRQEYQQKPMPLFLLWRGIILIALRFSHYKFILGGVSISNQFSDFSKSLMIEFMKSHYYDPYVAQYIRAKKEYKPQVNEEDLEFIFDETQADLNKFDKLIEELEPNALRLPVLIKKYIKQNARVIGFNVDPKFNDAIDGLMYIRISDIPESTIKPVLEEMQKQLDCNEKKQG